MKATVVAVFAALLVALAVAPSGANAAKLDNPSAPNFRMEVTGGYLQFIGTSGTPLQLPLNFGELDPPLPNPALIGSITPNSNGYGVINVPNVSFTNCQQSTTAGICFPPIPVNIDSIAIVIKLLPVGPATGFIDPLSGRVDLNVPIRLKAEGAALGQNLGNNCYVGSSGSPINLSTSTHLGSFPTTNPTPAQTVAVADFRSDGDGFDGGYLAAEPYSDESGTWPAEPKLVPGFEVGSPTKPLPSQIPYNELTDFIDRSAGSWRGINETLAAPLASGCGEGVLAGEITNQVNTLIGLPSAAGASTASLDFKFAPFADRPGTDTIAGTKAVLGKAVKSRFVAAGFSSSPWPSTQVPTAVSAQSVTLDASTSYFKVGGNATERYSFDFGTGSFGAWSTNPSATFTAPTLVEGADPVNLPIRVRVKDTEGDIDITTRRLRVVPATDISLDTTATSLVPSKFRAGSEGEVDFDVINNSANDASSLPLQLTASLPSGITFSDFQVPSGWTCNNTATTVDCSLPQGQLAADTNSHFNTTVTVSTGTANPAAINASVAMAGDPAPANNTDNISVPVVKTDLAVELTRTDDLIANGWTPYEIDVSNAGDGITVGGSTVDVALPADFSYRATGSGGTGWNCSTPVDARNVVCQHAGEIDGSSSAEPLTVVARVDRNAAAIPATVTATVSTQGDVNAFSGPDTDDDTETVQILPDLTVDASFSGSYIVGDPGTADFTVTNESVVSINGPTTMTAALPDGITVDSASGSGWDCSATVADSSEISCELAAGLAAAETSTAVTATLSVAQAAFPGITIDATVSNTEDGFAGNNTDALDVQVRRLDVSIQKLAVKPFNVGIEGRYRLNVTNIGDAPTVGEVVVIDELPLGLTLSGVSGAGWDCSDSQIGQRNVHCELNSQLGPGVQAAPIEARVAVLDEAAEAGTVVNTAYVDTPRDTRGVEEDEAITENNTSTISTPAVAVDLAIESTHQGDFMVETEDVYSLTVRNVGFFGTDEGASVTVTNDLPEGILPIVDEIEVTRPGWVCAEDEGDVECVLEAASPTDSAMLPESAVTIDIPVEVTDAAADSSDSVAEVSTMRDANPDLSPNNIAVDPTTVTRIDLAVAAEETIASRAGGIGEVAVQLGNVGSHATTAPSTVVVSLAPGTSYRPTGSTTAGWTCSSPGSGTQISCVRTPSIAAGFSAPDLKLRTNVSASAPADWVTDVSVTTGQEADTRLENNETTVESELETVDLEITKSHDPSNVKAGKSSNYKIHVENIGNTPSSGTIRVDETVPADFENVTASGPGWSCNVTGNAVACTRTASLAAGDTAPEITVNFSIPTSVSGTRDSVASLTHSGDPFPANNTVNGPITVVSAADATVAIEQPSGVRVGDNIDVTYRVRNIGAEATSGAPSVKLRVAISSGLEPVSTESTDGWECDTTPATESSLAYLDCELPDSVEPGGITTVNGEFEVVSTDDPGVETLAFVSTPGDINRNNDSDSAQSSLSGFDLAVAVNHVADATNDPVFGDSLVADVTRKREVIVTNDGTSTTTSPISVRVPLPEGVQWDEAQTSGTGWSCRLQVRDILCERAADQQLATGQSLPALVLGIKASRSNAPEVTMNYTADTQGDENPANSTATRTDTVLYYPQTTITAGPSGETTSRTATVSFSSDDEAATFECKLDNAAFEACTSPLTINNVIIGEHSVSVRAVNAATMADESPAVSTWTVINREPSGPSKRMKGNLTGGSLSLASLGSVPLPADQITLDGRLYESGDFVVPKEGVLFETVVQSIPDVLGPGTVVNVEISISATGTGAGILPTGGGDATFVLPVRADVQAKLGSTSVIPEGTECALNPVTFDLAGTYDESSKTVSLSSPSVGFPQVTGCDTFKGTIDSLLELPRNDISIDLDFALEEVIEDCPAGQTGTPPDCVTPPPLTANLSQPKAKGPKKVKSGKPVTITARVTNTGDAAASNVKLCLTLKKAKKLAKGKAKRCKTVKSIAAGKIGIAKFKIKTKKIKAKKAKLNYTVTAAATGVTKPKPGKGHVTVLK